MTIIIGIILVVISIILGVVLSTKYFYDLINEGKIVIVDEELKQKYFKKQEEE